MPLTDATLAEITLRTRTAERLTSTGDLLAATAIGELRRSAARALDDARARVPAPSATGGRSSGKLHDPRGTAPHPAGVRSGGELHDALGHALSLASLLAGAAAAQLATDPRAAATLLGELADTIATTHAALPHAPDTQSPAASLRALALGQPVTFELDEPLLTSLPQPVATALHGIVREALTNARVHAPGAPVRVRLTAAPSGDAAVLTVVSAPADGPRRPGSGRGLAGMRRRAHAVGGSFDAGNAVGGGFRVAARLPC